MTRKERGSIPGPIECGIILYIISEYKNMIILESVIYNVRIVIMGERHIIAYKLTNAS